ncbi:hypothetical protein SAMN04488065_2625 [Haloplanus vescus]|uniref:Uncharacterized protein n=1 Tax=Haloplanus vescus TaxID=555874 RepID=A0A1H4A7X8_9EURY|nr:hypothetical protein [Haloplanus vescus]SEA31652.1 hypothetical protein SAMN04488065_2625 [Haloplanus vescus]
MVTIEDISVTTAISDSEQALTIRADVDDGPTENLHYLRPLGTNTWFTLVGTGRADGPVNRDADGVPQFIHEVEEELVDRGYPLRPLQQGSNYPDPGSVEVRTGPTSERYPLFSHPSTVVVSKAGTTDDDISEDARVQVTYSDQTDDEFEYDIHVIDGDLPSDWVLEDLVIWAEGLVWGRTNRAHDRRDRPEDIDILYRNA